MFGTVSSQNVLAIIISELCLFPFFASAFFPPFLLQFYFFSYSLWGNMTITRNYSWSHFFPPKLYKFDFKPHPHQVRVHAYPI